MPYFHIPPFVISKQYGEGEMSRVVIFVLVLLFLRIFVMYLLFYLWKYVDRNQPLFCLARSCFFPHTLILCTLLNLLYFCYFRLES